MRPVLSVLSTSLYLPPAQSVRALARAAGADTDLYHGWDNVGIAEDEHPGEMGARVLRQSLDRAGIDSRQLGLVISAGMSRDYLPSWSMAAEWMKLTGASARCFGLDITSGCLGTLAGLDLAHGWLASRGGGYAAVVVAERMAYTIDRSNVEMDGLWAHADGAGALILAMNQEHRSLIDFHGAEFYSLSQLNGAVLVKYGGTRHPIAPPSVNPYTRSYVGPPLADLRRLYSEGYCGAFRALQARFGLRASRLVCNQISPGMVDLIAELAGVSLDGAVVSGHQTGHIGSVDTVVGLERILLESPVDAPIFLAASTPYAFGAGLLTPPGGRIQRIDSGDHQS